MKRMKWIASKESPVVGKIIDVEIEFYRFWRITWVKKIHLIYEHGSEYMQREL